MVVEAIVRITLKDGYDLSDPDRVIEVLNEMDYEFRSDAIEDTEIVDINWEID
jgi:hypothetical protein